MRNFIYCLAIIGLFAACRAERKSDPPTSATDSVAAAADTTMADSVPAPPEAADGLFDDFIYSFMRSPRFQSERTDFPLSNVVDGVNHPIARKDWKFDPLYIKQDVYTMIFDNARSVNAGKDTTLHHVVVEWVYLDKKRVKQYLFDKVKGCWRLVGLDTHELSKNANSDFYDFYRRFSSDTGFQETHIANPFHFKTYDYDQFQNIEGLLDVNQWPDYRPELPARVITNINYGQNYGDGRRRVLMICSPSGGMGCSLTFARSGKSWKLERLEN